MLVCDDCGRVSGERGKTERYGKVERETSDEDLVVEETACPFQADVHNDPNVPATLCGRCYQERVWDI